MTDSVSALTDLATYVILNRELTNCPRTAAALGEIATQWQQMGSQQRAEQETVTSQNLANALGNMNRTRIDATVNRLRLKDGERLYPKSWSGSTSQAGFEREISALLGHVDRSKRRRPTAVTLKTTSMSNWTTSWRWHKPM